MFTGIVQGVGVVEAFSQSKKGGRLIVETPKKFPSIKIGGSVSVNGACLTVVKKERDILLFDVVAETIRKTNFSLFKIGTHVNLEPALRYNDRIEGHFVQGHVDGVGQVLEIKNQKNDLGIKISSPPKTKPYLFEKGSITVNGVSLTIGSVQKSCFWIYLIPHTLKLTNLGSLKKSDLVNLEADVLVKFLEKL